ncbi:MAG: two-component system nitrogen regulation sensor histidine kinase NtrY [Alphaproteobacteria bacterium]|jgi:two-component system nitrogen regulation sensor histidine kinase NtrY
MTTADTSEPSPRNWLQKGAMHLGGRNFARVFTVCLTLAALISGVATYTLLTQSPDALTSPGAPGVDSDASRIYLLLNLDLVLLLLLVIVIARRVVRVWSERRRGSAGSRLHVQLVVLFGVISAAPAIVVAVFSGLFFNFGLESWFSERVRTTLTGSLAVAEAYLEEHKRNITVDVLQMARDLDNRALTFQVDQKRLNKMVNLQARVRELSEAVVFTGAGDVLARSGLTGALEFEPVPADALSKARDGEVAVLTNDSDDRVRALIRLTNFLDHYLYVGRFVDPTVIAHMERTRGAVHQFESLELQREDLQIQFSMIFAVVALLLLLAAVWVGLNVATRLSRPIGLLISTTEKIRAGDLSARVPEAEFDGNELGSLSRAFNRMTNDLDANRRELIEANLQVDARRVFSETVLSGVSSGVIGLDRTGALNLPNRAASILLGVELDSVAGAPLEDVIPEFSGLIDAARHATGQRPIERQIQIKRPDGERTLLVRVGVSRIDNDISGFVVTFDDISDLLSAQRKAAWADVARRIAHEIKNPLTPIQLSAERLKRKYLKDITNDPETFENCTDTIIRQVGDIGRMVDEFSNFARMPAPSMKIENISDLCRQSLFLQRNAHRDIDFVSVIPADSVSVNCDGRQISQAMTNLLQNACDAIDGNAKSTPGPDAGSDIAGNDDRVHKGRIVLTLELRENAVAIVVEDNGKGLPRENREKLTEPYITSRAKGTGLGLAIVKKIMEDHDGRLALEDGANGGARVSLILPNGPEDGVSENDAADAV